MRQIDYDPGLRVSGKVLLSIDIEVLKCIEGQVTLKVAGKELTLTNHLPATVNVGYDFFDDYKNKPIGQ